METEKDDLNELTTEQLGKLFPIRVVPYNPDWRVFFEREKALITEILDDNIVQNIEHFGSTSVEGLPAKPTIDIMVEVSNLSIDMKRIIIEKLRAIGYENMINAERENKMTFGKGYDENYIYKQSYHVHIREKGDTPQDEIYFRDILRQNSEIRDEYGKLKYILAEKYQFNREDYTQAKTDFIIKTMNTVELEKIKTFTTFAPQNYS